MLKGKCNRFFGGLVFSIFTLCFHPHLALGTTQLPQAKFLNVDGNRVAYYESRGRRSPSIIFLHANSLSARSFADILQGPIGKTYRVVAIDLPGHGASDNARHPLRTYSLPGFAAVLVRATHLLGVEESIFVGWSLGGHVLMEAIPNLNRAKGVLIFGAPPVNKSLLPGGFLPNLKQRFFFQGDLNEFEMDEMMRLYVSPTNRLLPHFYLNDIKRADPKMRSLLGISILIKNYSDEQVNLAEMKVPLAIFHGSEEQIVDYSYLQFLQAQDWRMPTLWRKSIQVFPNVGHAIQYEAPRLFESNLQKFIEDVLQ